MRTIKLSDPKNRVNLVYSTDWHASERPPGRRGDDYRTAILEKIDFVRQLTERLNGAALCGADVFHNKEPKHVGNSYRLLSDLYNTLSRFPQGCVFGSVGNHDLLADRMDSLPRQPLGLLIEVGAYHDLNRETVLFTNSDESIKVSVETFPYAESVETIKNILNSGPRHPDVNYRIGIVHAYGRPGGESYIYSTRAIGYDELKGADFDFLLWGHDHSRHETETVGGITHINLGSLARAAYSYDELDRPVVATVLSFAPDGVRVKEFPIPVKPLEAVFRIADKGMDAVSKSDEVKGFLTEMDDTVADMRHTDPRTVLQELCQNDPKLLSLVMELCEL
jgi:hypothetical protein